MSNLALDLRPSRLEDLIGNDHIKKAISKFAETDNWPKVFLLYGPPGTGKTTLALIIAKLAGAEGDGLHEINASGENGVDSARALAEISGSVPFVGRRRAIILNEFHQFTIPAQNVLKDPMEKNPALWILTTDRPDKVESAIRSRAAAATFELKPLNRPEVSELVRRVLTPLALSGDQETIVNFLLGKAVLLPREILGVLDLYLAGTPLEQTVHGAEHEPLYKDIAGAVLRGDWTKASGLLAQVKTADSRGLVGITSSFLRTELLRQPVGPKADALAVCLTGLDSTGFADGVAYGAVTGLLYRCAKALGGR